MLTQEFRSVSLSQILPESQKALLYHQKIKNSYIFQISNFYTVTKHKNSVIMANFS